MNENDIAEGLRDAFKDTIEGIVALALLSATITILKTTPNLPSYYPLMLQLVEIAMLFGSIFVVFQIESWRFTYLIGWLLGMWILYYVKLVDLWLFILYAAVGVPSLVAKFFKMTSK
jgi:hypothetical protein